MFGFNPQGEMMNRLQELKQNPAAAAQKSGFNIPEEAMGDPKQMVMHLINSGQVSGPALQRIMPMIRQMGGR